MTDDQQKLKMALAVEEEEEVKSSDQMEEDIQTPVSLSNDVSTTSLGGRVRKTTQMFTFTQVKSDEADEFLPPVGKGSKVRDMEFVRSNVEALGKKHLEMIKQLYSIMFGRRFKQKNVKVIKEHILDFSGIVEQDEKSREQLVAKMCKWKLIFVHQVMDFLAIDRSKKSFDEKGKPLNKEGLLERLVDWLYNPQETQLGEKKAMIAAKKAKQKANKRAKTTKKSESELPKKKRRTIKRKGVVEEENQDENDDESMEAESSSDIEQSKRTIMKKKTFARQPKKSRIVESDNDDDERENEMICSAEKDKLQSGADKPANEVNGANNEETKCKGEILDADVCNKVRGIIANGNAEELTVKKIIRQLSADLGRDMSGQKKAIKEFITTDLMEI
ncbi:unnamed protein product [Peronospora belbahrii]|uniref:DEK-C domain-containing protein n=1 Tax=Peronospora belbahrii TaxID=622444 RepID=A0AAU9L4S7_9STRA|nr:unnamed protein product [Peronospora belbahrii]CAH0514081.1 unnamed protein product [Peronospora belbahrii]